MKCKFCSLLPFCSIYFIPALLDCFLNMKFWNITYFLNTTNEMKGKGQIFGGGRNHPPVLRFISLMKKALSTEKNVHTCLKEPAALLSCVSLSLSHKTVHFWHFWSPNVGGFSSNHQVILCNTSWFSCNVILPVSTWGWGLSLLRLSPTSEASHESRLSPVLQCFWSLVTSEVPMTPSLGLINLLEQFTKLRETLMFTSWLKDMIKDGLPKWLIG